MKGGFLDADKAYEVLTGLKTYEMRVLQKAINTTVLARILDAHPDINVSCPVLAANPNNPMMLAHMHLGLPAALFTIDVEGKGGRAGVPREAYKRFLDMLEPAVGMQVSLGQTNTLALCPAMTTHSELSEDALGDAGIARTTTRIAVGLEDPRMFVAHMQRVAELAIDPVLPGFSDAFPDGAWIDEIFHRISREMHDHHLNSLPKYSELSS